MTDPSTGPSAGSGGASGHSTLDILRSSHRALLDYEAAREAQPRSEAGQAAVRKIAEAHREAWVRAGGKESDFLLAALLDGEAAQKAAPQVDGQPPAPDAKPKGDEASGREEPAQAEERPKGRVRKEA